MAVSSSPQLERNKSDKTARRFKSLSVILAGSLASLAVWILIAEFLRTPPAEFPIDPDSARVKTDHNAAHIAARVGVIRGDLWAEDALTYSDVFRRDGVQDSDTIEHARVIAERALVFAPHDARIWLILASVDSRFDWLNGKASTALRLSYYTGANEVRLIPVRLSLSLALPAISDPDFQQLVSHDLRIIVLRHPELKPAILSAYRNALPAGQQFVQAALKELDPNLISKLEKRE